MKLIDIVNNNLIKHKVNKNFSLIPGLSKLKASEYNNIVHFLDNDNILNTYVNGWNCLHYACLNTNPVILKNICDLLLKHNISFNSLTQTNKKECKKGASSLDICAVHHKISHYLILKNYGATQELSLNEFASSYIKKDYAIPKFNYNFQFPYPDNILTRFSINSSYLKDFLNFFLENKYEEKQQYITEFIFNHSYIINYFTVNNLHSDNFFWSYRNNFDNLAEDISKNIYNSIPYELITEVFYEFIYQKLLFISNKNNIIDKLNLNDFSDFKIYKNCFTDNSSNNSNNNFDNIDYSLFYNKNFHMIEKLKESRVIVNDFHKINPDVKIDFIRNFLNSLNKIFLYEDMQKTIPINTTNNRKHVKI